jgi:signal transduction histidine kinase
MVSKNAARLVNDLLDNFAIFDRDLNLICLGESLKNILSENKIDLNLCKDNSQKKTVHLNFLINKLESTRSSKQPTDIQLPGIKDEFIILPTNTGIYFLGLKNKIIRISKIEHDLQERVKELECLYDLSKNADESNNVEDFLKACPQIIEAGFQYPEDTKVIIEIADKIYGYAKVGIQEGMDLLAKSIFLEGQEIGILKVYLKKGLGFLREEENLVNEIVIKISHIVEKDEKARNLKKQQEIFKLKNEALVRMTQECHQKREELSTVFKAMSDKIVVIDNVFNILMSNKDDIGNSGKCYSKLFNLNYPCEKCPAEKVFSTKNSSMLAMELSDRHYNLNLHPIMGIEGKVDRILEVCMDVTDQKRMESQLLQSYKLASLGKLVAGVAHEINNPNTFILGNLKILQESLTDIFPILDIYYKGNKELKIARLNYELFKDNIGTLVNDMIEGASKTKKIVNDLRNFAKKDEGGLTDIVDLNDLIKNHLNLTTKQVRKYASLEVDLDENIPKFKGNINKLEQVLLNLVMNASEAIENENGLIKLKTEFNRQKDEVNLIVSDNGCGMSEAVRNNIFDPFFTTKRKLGGIGLGLSITYGIIKDHHGTIEVNSKVGQGTTFVIHIPIKYEN